MFRSFGPWEILLILGIVMLLFGASRLPQMGNSLGRGLREFKNGITGNPGSFDGDDEKKEKASTDRKDGSPGVQH